VETRVDQDTEFDADLDRSMVLMSAPRRTWPPIFQRVGKDNVMDLVDVAAFPDLPAHRKVLLLVFLVVVRDRASALRFVPWRFEEGECNEGDERVGFRLVYEVDGQEHELVPPPRWLSRFVAREIESLADLSRPLRRVADVLRRIASWLDGQDVPPRRGRFRVKLGGTEIGVDVWAYPSDLGAQYDLLFMSRSDVASAAATRELKRLCGVKDDRLCPDLR
jgi:hypothetical protein